MVYVAITDPADGSLRTMLWAVSRAVGNPPDVEPPVPRHGIRSALQGWVVYRVSKFQGTLHGCISHSHLVPLQENEAEGIAHRTI